ncbi:hypothetical protein FRB90_009574 [Tulasnella sp. 427]|nr:hypothetical protein FRB90_009574 [Tulasnella sp. 427]
MASTSGGSRQRPPPPPLRLQQSAFSTSTTPSSSISMSRGEITTTAGPGTGTTTPTTAQLLYELPPELVESRRRMAQEQQERSRARHTLQTQYRAQQAAAITSRSRSGSNDAATLIHPRPVANGRILEDTNPAVDFELRTPTARHSISGPPGSRPRSTTPSHALMSPIRSDLETFAQNCKAWFFAQDAAAGKAMTDTLAALPSSQKATYTKLQASVRSAYHTWTSLRRLQEFRAFLASTTPGASLTPPARSDPHSPLARKERLERFARFVQTFCQAGAPGTHPFFEGLYGLLRLQSLGENLGGAGSARIEWEVDDSVFLESGGKEFTTEAINNLKGVLGFEESLVVESGLDDSFVYDANPSESEDENYPASGSRTPAEYTPVPTGSTRGKPPPPAVPLRGKPKPNTSFNDASANRDRAGSDPFLDQTTGLLSGSPGQGPSSSFKAKSAASGALLNGIEEGGFSHDEDSGVDSPAHSYGITSPLATAMQQQHSRHQSQPLPSSHTSSKPNQKPRPPPPKRQHSKNGSNGTPLNLIDHPTSPSYSTFQQHDFDLDRLLSSSAGGTSPPGMGYRPPTQAELDLLHTPQLRVWTIPSYLTNPEIMTDLLPLFPSFIASKALPRFTAVKPSGKPTQSAIGGKKEPDVEEGGALGMEEDDGVTARESRGEVKKGTGRMWIGEKVRDDGWRGGFWTRLMLWFKGMFR